LEPEEQVERQVRIETVTTVRKGLPHLSELFLQVAAVVAVVRQPSCQTAQHVLRVQPMVQMELPQVLVAVLLIITTHTTLVVQVLLRVQHLTEQFYPRKLATKVATSTKADLALLVQAHPVVEQEEMQTSTLLESDWIQVSLVQVLFMEKVVAHTE
jgi:hypothetical protein